MTDQWKQISVLYDAVLKLPEDERAAYLKKHASGEEVRLEVESLLAHDLTGAKLLESPALEVAAKMMANENPVSMTGRTLGHYQVVSLLGKGGMGEVYRAKDLKLRRDVAIKVLPEAFARDTDRVARFQREAKLLASLNHPNIAAIYGLEEHTGTHFLAMELVEGRTLAEWIKSGPIPVEESLKLAVQIAEALEAAHEKGVIHRDLKPANIKVTPDSKAKVLDFGLAKAFAGDQAEVNSADSPTISELATRQGVILGTATYMSPEQARGKVVDKRADIWAFGSVFYEMLTGRVAFQGEDVSEILASVIKGDVKLDLLPATLHPRMREVITRCLQKDLKKRYQDIGDLRFEVEQASADPNSELVQPILSAEPQTRLRTIIPWIAALILTAIIVGVAAWKLKPPEPRQVVRYDYELPEGQRFSYPRYQALAVSPDGGNLVYSTEKGLYLRPTDEMTAKLITGTEERVTNPFFSPDGEWIGYISLSEGKLKKISINGGAPVVLCDVVSPIGASWGSDDTIVYAQLGRDIMRIPAKGGAPESLVAFRSPYLCFPQILPDGKSVLYTAISPTRQSSIMVQSSKSGEPKELFGGTGARYLPTGHIVYAVGSDLLAVPFDTEKLEVGGGPVSIGEAVYRAATPAAPQFALSDSGTLAYIPSTAAAVSDVTLVWVDRNGKEEPLAAPPNAYVYTRVSPDGTRVAMAIRESNTDIWIWDLIHKTLTRLTFDPGVDLAPIWTRDGKRIVFASNRTGQFAVYWKPADGTGNDEELFMAPEQGFLPWSFSSDGRTLAMEEVGAGALMHIWVLSMEGDRARKPLLYQEKQSESEPEISPDGQWIAYTSDESGKNEIYVRPFPDVDRGMWQVSTIGGAHPLWSPDGRELFFLSEDNSAMAIAVETKPVFKLVGTPVILFRAAFIYPGSYRGIWHIHPDGKRFIMMKETGSSSSEAGGHGKINIVVNWFEELKQKVPKQ